MLTCSFFVFVDSFLMGLVVPEVFGGPTGLQWGKLLFLVMLCRFMVVVISVWVVLFVVVLVEI